VLGAAEHVDRVDQLGHLVERGNIGTPNTSGAEHLGFTRRRPSLPDAARIQQTSALRPSCLNRVRLGDAFGAAVLRDQRADRLAEHGKADPSPEHLLLAGS
jgi:hypothetical protein